jgi:transcriptional regulator with XRE-family HTH domain
MADIGSLLRETRIRKKIDITTVEDATKIRAKYLRALENEEWVVLPGPTYVKTFLRTYAQFLGLDPRLLVEEYSARFEEPEDLEVAAFAPRRRLPDRARRVGPPSRGVGALLLVAAFIGFLLVLGLTGGDDNGGTSTSSTGSATRSGPRQGGEPTPVGGRERPAKRNVRLEVVAARNVWVCVVDADGTARVNAETLAAGDRKGPFRSKAFRVTVGNGGGDLRIDGRRRDTPDRAEPIGYLVRPSGTKVLAASSRPTCG